MVRAGPASRRVKKGGGKMPWHIEKRGGERPWKIIKTSTGEVVGSSKTKADAQGSIAHKEEAEKRK